MGHSHECCALTVSSPIEVHTVPTCMHNPPCKYGKARVQYYANTIATYQLILESGDVHPNPGPVTTGQTRQHTDTEKLLPHQTSRVCYDVERLHYLKPRPHTIQQQRLPIVKFGETSSTWESLENGRRVGGKNYKNHTLPTNLISSKYQL